MKIGKSKRPAAEQDEIVEKVRALYKEAMSLSAAAARHEQIIKEISALMHAHEAEFDLLDRITNIVTGNEE